MTARAPEQDGVVFRRTPDQQRRATLELGVGAMFAAILGGAATQQCVFHGLHMWTRLDRATCTTAGGIAAGVLVATILGVAAWYYRRQRHEHVLLDATGIRVRLAVREYVHRYDDLVSVRPRGFEDRRGATLRFADRSVVVIPAGLVTYEALEDALCEMVAPTPADVPGGDASNPGTHDDVVVSTTDRRWLDRAVVVFAVVVLPALAALGIGQAPHQWLTILGATSMVSGILLAGVFRTHRGFTVARAETEPEH